MNWIYGFFMAWGMFLTIPCPVRIWKEKARRHMLACLPLVGGLVGGLWGLLAWVSPDWPTGIRAFLLTALPWLCTGFMHLDGFMDVCDAVLSRRDLPTRQKILKDSHCGAFGVICVVLLMLGQWSVFLSAGEIRWYVLPMVCGAVRACAGMAILLLRPMGTSQYAAMEGSRKPFAVLLGLVFVVLAAVSALLWGSFAPLAAGGAYWLMVWYGFCQLDGMNGDISGFVLTLAELVGVIVLIFVG